MQKRMAAPSGTCLGRPRVACATTQIYEKVWCDGFCTEDENARPNPISSRADTELRTAKLNEAPKNPHADKKYKHRKSKQRYAGWVKREGGRAKCLRSLLHFLKLHCFLKLLSPNARSSPCLNTRCLQHPVIDRWY